MVDELALFDPEPVVRKDANLSPCGAYRYWLTRQWGDGPLLPWVMLNPSDADAERDDPTVTRVIRFTQAWGFPGMSIRNLYALRSPDPAALWSHREPVGPDNDAHLAELAGAPMVVCAWGNHGARNDRGHQVAAMLAADGARLVCLKVTGAGQPWHPLYTPAWLTPIPYEPQAAA